MIYNSKFENIQTQISRIEEEIRKTPYHKGTEHHIGKLRARLSILKEKLLEYSQKKGAREGYAIKKQGDATVILIGPPSVGKSTLLNKLTNAKSKVAPYAFTTVSVIPGMMNYKNANIQILDVPGLIEGAEEGKGRGKEILSVARGADLILIIVDPEHISSIERIKHTLEKNGIRLNQKPPQVVIDKKTQGGIVIRSNIYQTISKDYIKEIALEFGIKNAEITINENITLNRLIDAFSKNRVYIPSLIVINKIDLLNDKNHTKICTDDSNHQSIIHISAEKSIGLDELKEKIWETLEFITVYLVRQDEEPSFYNPIVIKNGSTLRDIANLLGTDFVENKRKAIIWGKHAKYPGQEVSLSTTAEDGLQVRFI